MDNWTSLYKIQNNILEASEILDGVVLLPQSCADKRQHQLTKSYVSSSFAK